MLFGPSKSLSSTNGSFWVFFSHLCTIIGKCSLTATLEIGPYGFQCPRPSNHWRINVTCMPLLMHNTFDLFLWRSIRLISKGRPFNMHNWRGCTRSTWLWSKHENAPRVYACGSHGNMLGMHTIVLGRHDNLLKFNGTMFESLYYRTCDGIFFA